MQIGDDGVTPAGDEDCLQANLWVPEACMSRSVAGGCATMLWVHGGGYEIGSGINYDGARNAALGTEVIIVTVNYRLSVFGWLASEELATRTGEGGSTGAVATPLPASMRPC